jgi:hypothetical protein
MAKLAAKSDKVQRLLLKLSEQYGNDRVLEYRKERRVKISAMPQRKPQAIPSPTLQPTRVPISDPGFVFNTEELRTVSSIY